MVSSCPADPVIKRWPREACVEGSAQQLLHRKSKLTLQFFGLSEILVEIVNSFYWLCLLSSPAI